jgi:hypothetical protein
MEEMLYWRTEYNKILTQNKTILFLVAIWLIVSGVYVYEPLRDRLTGWSTAAMQGTQPSDRSVVGILQTDLTGNGNKVTITKVKSKLDISLEIYFYKEGSKEPQEIKRIILDDRRDAFFDMKGSVTNLAAVDLDGDAVLEIFAPSFDENLIPRMNVFKYDPTTGDFEKLDYRTFPL